MCIFSFCCIAIRAGNKGCGQTAARMQQPMLCTPPVGIAAASEGGSAACENAAYGTSCLFHAPRGAPQPAVGLGLPSAAVLGKQSWAMLPTPGCRPGGHLAGGCRQCRGGEPGSRDAGQPPGAGLVLKSVEAFEEPFCQGVPGEALRVGQICVGFEHASSEGSCSSWGAAGGPAPACSREESNRAGACKARGSMWHGRCCWRRSRRPPRTRCVGAI